MKFREHFRALLEELAHTDPVIRKRPGGREVLDLVALRVRQLRFRLQRFALRDAECVVQVRELGSDEGVQAKGVGALDGRASVASVARSPGIERMTFDFRPC